jgi:hypothetical protein
MCSASRAREWQCFGAAGPNGAAVLIAPGGGYRWVVIDKRL